MKVLFFITYYLFAFLALITIPLVEIGIFPFTKRFDMGASYDLWVEHYKSGERWGCLDRGRP